ncbi:MAG: hypothetical protein KKF44_02815 [Nanoarchaeota archaeon]|nr:hypothetical protein [Nanoarchaeota archaeon]
MDTKVIKHLAEKDLKFLMLLLKSSEYDEIITNILTDFSKQNRICYILLRMPYSYFRIEMEKKGVNLENVFFIDVLSSHYKKQENEPNCYYLETKNIEQLKKAIHKNVCDGNCNMLLVDEINTLLHFTGGNDIQKLANDLKICEKIGGIKKIFYINKEEELVKDEMDNLIKDLGMYMDKIMESGNNLKK